MHFKIKSKTDEFASSNQIKFVDALTESLNQFLNHK